MPPLVSISGSTFVWGIMADSGDSCTAALTPDKTGGLLLPSRNRDWIPELKDILIAAGSLQTAPHQHITLEQAFSGTLL